LTWRKWLRDFATHFLGGYRTRYRPVWNCLRLTLSAGLGTLLTFIVAYRALNWLGAWLWYGATRTLGPYDLDTWQIISSVTGLLIGSPSDLDGGILLDAVRIALLAAVLEYAVSTQRRAVTANA
jgi:low temperature requirement protein LtrA